MELSCPLGTTGLVPREKFPQKPYNKSFIEQANVLWTSTPSRSINTQKKNSTNIQPSWPRTWSITHTYSITNSTTGKNNSVAFTQSVTRKGFIHRLRLVYTASTVFSRFNAPGSFDPAFFQSRTPEFNRGPAFINEMRFSALFSRWCIITDPQKPRGSLSVREDFSLDYPKLHYYGTVHTARVPCCNQDLSVSLTNST